MKLQGMLLGEIAELQGRGPQAIGILGFADAEDALRRSQIEVEFFGGTAGSRTPKRGHQKVVTDYAGPLWFPAPIAARVRCLESVYSWLRPFQIIEELSLDGDLGGWGYIDRAITALRHDLGCAAPAPEPEQVRAWQRRETRERNRIAA